MFYFHFSLIFLYLLTTTPFLVQSVQVVNKPHVKPKFNDILPMKKDLGDYLRSLERVINFCTKNINYLDLNFKFGLFLVNVNLKPMIKTKNNLPIWLHNYMRIIVKRNDEIIGFFNDMVKRDHDPRNRMNKMILALFTNESTWSRRLSRMDPTLLKETSILPKDQLEVLYSNWSMYWKNVDEVDKWIPKPLVSDKCMDSLAHNAEHSESGSRCEVSEQCYEMLLNGTDFGYALSHRLLFLLNARFGRGCSIFSPRKDKKLTRKFCAIAFNEAQYIAMHNYGIVDLFLEQICLCSLDGYAQFLRRSWLSKILLYQTPYGCFGQNIPKHLKLVNQSKSELQTWKMAKQRDHVIMGGVCDGHVTSVAAATLALASRYILENYY